MPDILACCCSDTVVHLVKWAVLLQLSNPFGECVRAEVTPKFSAKKLCFYLRLEDMLEVVLFAVCKVMGGHSGKLLPCVEEMALAEHWCCSVRCACGNIGQWSIQRGCTAAKGIFAHTGCRWQAGAAQAAAEQPGVCLGVPTRTARATSSETATALWSRAALRLAGLFCLWSGVSVTQDCGQLGFPTSHGSPGRAVCMVLGAALGLVMWMWARWGLGVRAGIACVFQLYQPI